MANENNGVNKDVSSSLNNYTDYAHKGTNVALNTANQINNWYANELNKIANADVPSTRLKTNVDNSMEETGAEQQKYTKLETKVDEYDELQTITNNKTTIKQTSRIKTQIDTNVLENNERQNEIVKDAEDTDGSAKNISKVPRRIATVIKGAKFVNNSANRMIKTGKTIYTGMNEGGLKSFEKSSSRIMTKPAKKVANKLTAKATNIIKKTGVKATKKVIKETTNIVIKATKVAMKIVAETVKLLMSMLPSIAPVVIIIVIIAAIGNFFNFKTTHEADNINFDEISSMIVVIEDEKIQAIYNEFLKNMGKPYLMDHSNLKYDECMDYYDCSSWVIHCLAHTGIKTIPNTGAQGIYKDHCNPIDVNDRQAGDLIFLKDTYDTGEPGSISHIGIYMGELTINGETAEWVIDTGSNPSGVRIRKYQDGWWNGSNFYGFGRLK